MRRPFIPGVILAFAWASSASAAPEEIIVFADEFEKRGEVGYEMHVNYARHARTEPAYPGEQPPDRALRVMPEVLWGVSENWNVGLHLPMSRNNAAGSHSIDGLKARLQYLKSAPIRAGTYFYGVNYELNYLTTRLSESRLSAEVRGIVGARYKDWLVAINPILNRPLSHVAGVENRVNLDLLGKVMKSVGTELAVGLEHYSELGRVGSPTFGAASGQTTYAVVEWATPWHFGIHLGVGHGWTQSVDKRVFKTIIGLPF